MMYTLKKSLGQHFLKDESICQRILEVLSSQDFHQLLEVGPGGGALTKYLLELKDIDFKAVELDEEKVVYLKRTYPTLNDKIIHQDFLQMEKPFEEPFTIVGNFPYNISTQILFKTLDWRPQVQTVIGMFQKEVAQRVVAKEGSKVYGVSSVLIQAFFETQYLFEVDENCFTPPPKVKSAVIKLWPREQPVDMRSEKHLFMLVKAAFNQRRKTMRNAVKHLFNPDVLADDIFNKRAEQVSVTEFGTLTFSMH